MTHPVIERRRAEQRERIELAREWAQRLARRLEVGTAVVFGSTARGDFNKWSDIDVLILTPTLPAGGRDRPELLMEDAPPGIQPIGWTAEEYVRRRERGDPIVRECEKVAKVILGELPGSSLRHPG